MRFPMILLFAFCFLISCGGKSGPDSSPVPVTQNEPGQVPAGQSLYKDKCVSCHGMDGTRGISGAKDLSVSAMPLEDRIKLITTGKAMMPAYGEMLSQDQIKAVAEYTLTLKK